MGAIGSENTLKPTQWSWRSMLVSHRSALYHI